MSDQLSEKAISASLRRTMILGFVLIILLIFGLGGWASWAKLNGAVITPGIVVVETKSQKVQHREGGIVQQIHVNDGDLVAAGDLLVTLDSTLYSSDVAELTKQLDELMAEEARLESERDGTEVSFPEDLVLRAATDPRVDALITGQSNLMEARETSIAGRKAQVLEQVKQLEEQVVGISVQRDARATTIELVDEQLATLRALFEKNLSTRREILEYERERAALTGELGELVSRMAQVREAISERHLLVLQLGDEFREEVLQRLQTVRAEITRLIEQKVAAQDKLHRMEIRSPRAGVVLELAVHTIGGVVAPGEVMMLIVPNEDSLVLETRVHSIDVDQLFPNQQAAIRFPAFEQRSTPELMARLTTLSPDLVEDPRTGVTYYVARLTLDVDEVEKLGDRQLVPGMPVEAFFQTGERSVLSYLMKPLTDQIALAFREQ